MKTSLDIPDQELADVVRFSQAKTKRDAIVTAVREFNQRHRMASLIKYSGTFEGMMTNEEIEALEESEEHNRP